MTRYTPTTDDPVRWAVMRQEWNNLAFVHWRVPAEVVQQRLPRGVRVDIHDGSAWVGLVAFHMERIGPARGFTVPYFGSFPETNIRTYVKGPDGRPGVWFDSLDVTRLVPTIVARRTYGLPYMWSSMRIRNRGDQRRYTARRRWGGPAARSLIDLEVGAEIPSVKVSPLERFLTCRWGLYSTFLGQLVYAPVEHPEWPLHQARLSQLDDTLSVVAGYPEPPDKPLVHWTPGVSVRIGRPKRVLVDAARASNIAVAPSRGSAWQPSSFDRQP